MSKERFGVFTCHCGGNISDVVDVDRIVEETSKWNNVVVSRSNRYLCSKPGVQMIRKAVKDLNLNRIVLACCTPKMHQKRFEKNLKEEGINPKLLKIVNVREQCSWVHSDNPDEATKKAFDLVKGAVKALEYATPLEQIKKEIIQSAVVIGGGIAGITAALRIAEHGLQVHLVEKESTIGGHMIQYPKVFPTLDCSQCILTPRMVEISENPNIKLHTLSEIQSVKGSIGDFTIRLKKKPRGVDPDKCMSCGLCNRICPVEKPNDFNEGLNTRKAVFIAFPQAVPSAYTIDFDDCTRCGKCAEVCPSEAIALSNESREEEIRVGTIILATGFQFMDYNKFGEYLYGKNNNVITSLQMERMIDVTGPTQGHITRLSDGQDAKSVAYMLCAGSRDNNRGLQYCSRVCCLYAIKQAKILRSHDLDVWIHYIDIRTPGRRYEEFYKSAQLDGVNFARGKIAEIIPNGNKLLVRAEDTLINKILENEVDLVVLCPPITTRTETSKLADLIKAPLDEDGFILEKHPKLDPVATKRDGVFACGMVLGPKDIQSTVSESEAAALKAVNLLREEVINIQPEKAFLTLDPHPTEGCDNCQRCIQICPTEAIQFKEERISFDEVTCIGCGACVPVCPVNAIDLQSITNQQLRASIDGILEDDEEVKIIAFTEREIAYTSADIAGVNRLSYPSSIRIVEVPSTSRVSFKDILYAFASGADGVMLLEAPEEGPMGSIHLLAEERADEYSNLLSEIDPDLPVRLWFSKVYVPDWRKLVNIFQTFDIIVKDEGKLSQELRNIMKQASFSS
jgi:heterodisulfide reductase subunit A